MSTSPERNLGEAHLDARYSAILQDLSARFYRRLSMFFDAALLLGGTATFGAFFAVNQHLGPWAGGLIAVMTILNHVIKPSEKAAEHKQCAKGYWHLLARTDLETLKLFDPEYLKLEAECLDGLPALEILAYNKNVVSGGFPDSQMKPKIFNRLIGIMVS